MTFEQALDTGKAAETAIARWLIRRGHSVLPVYEKIINEGKGPQLFTGGGGLVAPDMVAFVGKDVLWVEAKHKTAFTWYGIGQVYETGVDLRHYKDYIKVRSETGRDVWLLFLHKGGTARYSGILPSPEGASPSGLYGNEIAVLMANESHRSEKWGRSGMVYWSRECDGGALKTIASYDEVITTTSLSPSK